MAINKQVMALAVLQLPFICECLLCPEFDYLVFTCLLAKCHGIQDRCASHLASPVSVSTRLQLKLQLSC